MWRRSLDVDQIHDTGGIQYSQPSYNFFPLRCAFLLENVWSIANQILRHAYPQPWLCPMASGFSLESLRHRFGHLWREWRLGGFKALDCVGGLQVLVQATENCATCPSGLGLGELSLSLINRFKMFLGGCWGILNRSLLQLACKGRLNFQSCMRKRTMSLSFNIVIVAVKDSFNSSLRLGSSLRGCLMWCWRIRGGNPEDPIWSWCQGQCN